jgi:hypothetical protein
MVVLYGGPIVSWMCSFYTPRSEADAGVDIVLMVPVAALFVVLYATVAAVAVDRYKKA